MSKPNWKDYVDANGDFELASYLFRAIMDLMKVSLDMGTLLSNDSAKVRAFKEQTKNIFKKQWMELAQALEFFDIIVPCGCPSTEYCRLCSGSRYRLNSVMSPDELRETFVATSSGLSQEQEAKLQAGLDKALQLLGEP